MMYVDYIYPMIGQELLSRLNIQITDEKPFDSYLTLYITAKLHHSFYDKSDTWIKSISYKEVKIHACKLGITV